METPVYLQKVWTSDSLTRKHPAPLSEAQRDVVARNTPDGEILGRWPWFSLTKPTRRNRYVTLNCVTRPCVWLPDA